jgi:hypothetical protein
MKKVLVVSLFLSFLILPLVANAAIVDPATVLCNILKKIEKVVAAIGFGLAVILFVAGGIMYMTAGGDAEKSGKARKLMVNALIGIAIVFCAIFILDLVAGLLSGTGVSLLINNCPMSL